MAALTGHVGVFAIQFENEQAVVHVGREPPRRIMAGTAIRAELAVVLVILLMAGIAVLWRSIVHIIDMTFLADYIHVFACQFERGKIVVEFCREPSVRSMAIAAVRS